MSSTSSRSNDVRAEVGRALSGLLIEKIRTDQYPSATMMDAAEASIGDDRQLRSYIAALLEKVEADQFPSIDLIRRLSRLA